MVIRSVGVWSMAKMLAALYAGLGLLFGALLAGISLVGAGIAASGQDETGMPPWLGALFGVGAVVFLPLLYGLMGLVFGALTAVLYNLFAGMVGGIELNAE